jgi:hypothetical protein
MLLEEEEEEEEHTANIGGYFCWCLMRLLAMMLASSLLSLELALAPAS